MKYFITIFLIITSLYSSAQFFGLNRNYLGITYIDNGGLVTTGNATSIDITFPTVVAGDVLIAMYWQKQDDTFGSMTTPSGWTLIGFLDSDNDIVAACYIKIASGLESGNLTLSHNFSPNNGQAGIIFRYGNKSSGLTTYFTSIQRFNGNASSYTATQLTLGRTGFHIIGLNGEATITKTSGEFNIDYETSTSDNGGWAVAISSVLGDGDFKDLALFWGTGNFFPNAVVHFDLDN